MTEEWFIIPGFNGLYEISNRDNVKSLNFRNTGEEELLKPTIDNKGYIIYNLSKDGKQKTYGLHRLKAMTFIPIPERLKDYSLEELDVHHKDFCHLKNHVENLLWVTKEEHREIHRQSEITRKRISDKLKGHDVSDETKKKISVANKGRYHTDEAKQKISNTLKNSSYLSKAVEAYDDNDNIIYRFPSTQEAGRNGFSSRNVATCCRGERNYHKGLHWRYI